MSEKKPRKSPLCATRRAGPGACGQGCAGLIAGFSRLAQGDRENDTGFLPVKICVLKFYSGQKARNARWSTHPVPNSREAAQSSSLNPFVPGLRGVEQRARGAASMRGEPSV
ncbi:hypothetical protein AAFF_G00301020 [Aldrovandia affinis]|uniref:Uncharacterized protein n=1 Tax=Aldrovandia affinis TaxID=143900 RepID=A0AAD7WRN8_9TELE|nr:hypothetical protein AAFF_G00301020 [Aldrovandia affinis]